MERQVVIRIEDLPLRARQLSDDELSNVFGGGCQGLNKLCVLNKDCCSGRCDWSGYIAASIKYCV